MEYEEEIQVCHYGYRLRSGVQLEAAEACIAAVSGIPDVDLSLEYHYKMFSHRNSATCSYSFHWPRRSSLNRETQRLQLVPVSLNRALIWVPLGTTVLPQEVTFLPITWSYRYALGE
jgi:hypothetical protein